MTDRIVTVLTLFILRSRRLRASSPGNERVSLALIRTVPFLATCVLGLAISQGQSQTYVDLIGLFNADAVLEPGGAGLGNALDAEGRRIDAATLPSAYTDGSIVTTQDGRARFDSGPSAKAEWMRVLADGQVLDVVDGTYGSLDLALLSARGAWGSLWRDRATL